MVTWRAVGAGIVELVKTPLKLDRRPRRMETLGVADPGDGGPKPSSYAYESIYDDDTQDKVCLGNIYVVYHKMS